MEGRGRVVIEGLNPEIDGGVYPIKRVVGEKVVVEADVFVDGHDAIGCVLLYRKGDDRKWTEVPMAALDNDRWQAVFTVAEQGRYLFTASAWVDHFLTWRQDLVKRIEAEQDDTIAYLIGAELMLATAERAKGKDAKRLRHLAGLLEKELDSATRRTLALGEELKDLMTRYPDRGFAHTYNKELSVTVDRARARFSTWYEFFPRSCASGKRHATFKDCEARLAYVAAMGFDVVYLPPIHPIGRSFRKGKNNSLTCEPGDVGSPWAIGAMEGGHKAVHPTLGTLEDFRQFVQSAGDHGLEVALDIAFQCSPDHPYVKQHPEWFRWRPDNTVQYAENPPKKYQDIYPFDFETKDWQALWNELKDVFLFWIQQGVKIFRVDNPHTKPLPFWEWLIGEIKKDHPETLFLAEAFTRPKVMYRLAKLGFTQSYTYFTWRNTKHELIEYFTELTRSEVAEYFRPSVWPNTPDILHEYLQFGGRPAFMIRLSLAATMAANYGIYGPAYELCENTPRESGSEEYLNSEKYEIREWDLNHANSLKDFIARVNRARHENSALQCDHNLMFHPVDNDRILCFSKHTEDLSNIVLTVVNLDTHHTQSGWVELPLLDLGLDETEPYQVHDLLTDARYIWYGARNYVELNPHAVPAHIFRMRRRIKTEHDFDYYT
jgi:starch synthase (maltosyl-transferring)